MQKQQSNITTDTSILRHDIKPQNINKVHEATGKTLQLSCKFLFEKSKVDQFE